MKSRREYIIEKLFGYNKEAINSVLQIEDNMRCENCFHYMKNDTTSGVCNYKQIETISIDTCTTWSPKTFIADRSLV